MSQLWDPHLTGGSFRLGKRNKAQKGLGGKHMLGVGPITHGQTHGCSFIQLPDMPCL